MKISLLTFLLGALSLCSQDQGVKGTISDEILKMDSLVFANVILKSLKK